MTLTLYWQLTYPLQWPGFTSGWGFFWVGGGLWCLFLLIFSVICVVLCLVFLCLMLPVHSELPLICSFVLMCYSYIHGVEYSVLWNMTSIKKGMLGEIKIICDEFYRLLCLLRTFNSFFHKYFINYLDFQSFDCDRSRRRLFQKHVVRTKLDLYINNIYLRQ